MDKTVLCIENNTEMLDLIAMILQRCGFEVVGAVTGEDGVAMAQHYRPCLILLDLALPQMDGWTVYGRLRASSETRDIPVIVVTAIGTPSDRRLWLQRPGVIDYIIKPFTPREFIHRVQEVWTCQEQQNLREGQVISH